MLNLFWRLHQNLDLKLFLTLKTAHQAELVSGLLRANLFRLEAGDVGVAHRQVAAGVVLLVDLQHVEELRKPDPEAVVPGKWLDTFVDFSTLDQQQAS